MSSRGEGRPGRVIGGCIYRNRGNKLPDGTDAEAFACEDASLSVCGISGDTNTREVQGGQTRAGKFGDGRYVGRKK